MVGSRGRPREVVSVSPELSFESDGSYPATPSTSHTKLTVDTSSLTSSDTAQWHLPNENEVSRLRRSISGYERREGRLQAHIARLQKDLDAARENSSRWKQAVQGDVRPGSQYRKEIASLKQKLEKQKEIIQEKDNTIDNLMAGNHPNHPLLIMQSDSHETSVCSSLLDELVEPPPAAREMERLLLENSNYAQQLEEKDTELRSLRAKVLKYSSSDNQRQNQSMDSSTSEEAFDPFQWTDLQNGFSESSESSSNNHTNADSIRVTKRVMELNNALSKITKERNTVKSELEQSLVQVKHLRKELNKASLHHQEKVDEIVAELEDTKLALHDAEIRAENSSSALESHKVMIRDVKATLRKRESTIFDLQRSLKKQNTASTLTSIDKDDSEVDELKKALDESLEELESVTNLVSDQRQTIQKLKKDLDTKKMELLQMQDSLRVKTRSLQETRVQLMKRDSELTEILGSSALENEKRSGRSNQNEIQCENQEFDHLRQDAIVWESKNNCLRKMLVEKEFEISKLSVSLNQANDSVERMRNIDVRVHTDGLDGKSRIEQEYKLLLEKSQEQASQLLNTDKVLLAKESEKNRLKDSLQKLRDELTRAQMEKAEFIEKMSKHNEQLEGRLMSSAERNENGSKTIGENVDVKAMRRKAKNAMNSNLLDQDNMLENVLSLQKDLEKKSNENNELQEALSSETEKVKCLQSRVEDVEKQLQDKIEQISQYKHTTSSLKIKGEVGEDLECRRQKLDQIKEQIRVKDSFIARLINSQEDAKIALKSASLTQAELKDQLKLMEAKVFTLQEAKEKLLAERGSINMNEKVIQLQNEVDCITLKKNEKEYEMDILVNKFAKLSEQNDIFEAKYKSLEASSDIISKEAVRLQENFVKSGSGITSLQSYIDIVTTSSKSWDIDDRLVQDRMFDEICKARRRLFDDLTSLETDRRTLSRREQELDAKDKEIEKIEEEKQSLRETMSTQAASLRSERLEKEKILHDRSKLMLESSAMHKNIESLKQTNNVLQLKVQTLETETTRTNEIAIENVAIKRENAAMKEDIRRLTDEVKDLNQKMVCQTSENEVVIRLKNDLERTRKSENEKVNSYERQISALTMNKDVTIDTLRNDLAVSRSRCAEEVARLTTELSKLEKVNINLKRQCNTIETKDKKIHALEQTLHAQEKTVESLRCELDQVQLSMRNASEQRRRDLEELQKDLIESKSHAKNQEREILSLKAKLDESKTRYENEINLLSREVERLKNLSPVPNISKDSEDSNLMLEAKQRLEQLRVLNIELKDDNIELSTKLEKTLTKVQELEGEIADFGEIENECAELRAQLKDLKYHLEENEKVNDQKPKAKQKRSILDRTKSIGLGKGGRTKLSGRGKGEVPTVLYIETSETLG